MIRTTDQLLVKIAEDLVWRRKELTELRSLAQTYDGQLKSRVIIRSAVALLYAHWEGFVKKAASYYLEYVASHRLPYKRLTSNFVALKLKKRFVELQANDKVSGGNELADFFCNTLEKQSNIPYKNVIDTKSNLSSTVLTDILTSLGLSQIQFATRLTYIDTNLVNPRNHVAHGEDLGLSVAEYIELHDNVIALIEMFRNEVENSSVQRRFERI